ncbi:MAG: hypothetical protein ACNFW9_00200 [Candidatus Kerfeldbacteria bacterium]|jgi:hypothetical protein
MLVQKTSLNKRTKGLLMILVGIIIIGGGYFGFMAISDKTSQPENNLITNNGTINLSNVQSGVDGEIFDDPQFLSLSKNKFDGFTDQYSGITLSDSKPIEITSSQVNNPKTGNRLIISWQLPEYVNFDTVSIYRSLSPGFVGEQIYSATIESIKSNKITSYQDRDVENTHKYYYIVQSEIYDGSTLSASNSGSQFNGMPTDEIPPASPEFVQVQGLSDGDIEISWFNPEDSDLDMIKVYRSTEKGNLGINIYGKESGNIGLEKVGGLMNYILDTSAENNIVYYYIVTSVDISGNESSTDIVSSSYKSYFYNPFDPIDF